MKKNNNLTRYEHERDWIFKSIENLIRNQKLTPKSLSLLTQKSIKQCRRYIQSYKEQNFKLSHKNKNKQSWRLKNQEFNQKITNLYVSINKEISDFRQDNSYRLSHKEFYLSYFLTKNLQASYSYVNKVLNDNFLITRNTKKKTKRELRKRLKFKNNVTNSDTLTILNKSDIKYLNLIEYNQSKQIPYVKHNYDFGQIVELDACVEKWFNNKKYYLYHAIDAGTGKLLSAWIEKEETNNGYAYLLRNLIQEYGCPVKIKTDKRKTFWSEKSKTNLTFCLNQLGIEVESKSEPTFKPNVERSFQNAQNFYPYLMFKNQIKSLEQFKDNLNVIVDAYNDKFHKNQIGKNNVFSSISNNELKNAFFVKKECKVHKGFYIFFENKNYCLINSQNQRTTFMKSKITLKKDLITNELFFIDKETKYLFKEIDDDYIDTYINEICDNQYAELEKEKRKQQIINQKIRESLYKKQVFLKQKEQELMLKENKLNFLIKGV